MLARFSDREFALCARPLALLGHETFKASAVDAHTLLFGDDPRQVGRKAVRIIQAENIVAGHSCASLGAQPSDGRL